MTISLAASSRVSMFLSAFQVKLPTNGAWALMFGSALLRAEARMPGLSDAQRRMAASMSASSPICMASLAQDLWES
jgi:hypothetical protein